MNCPKDAAERKKKTAPLGLNGTDMPRTATDNTHKEPQYTGCIFCDAAIFLSHMIKKAGKR